MSLPGLQLNAALRHTLIYAAALGLSKAFSLLMVPVATRFLSPADYGILDILQTLADLLGIVIGMGMTEVLFRFAGSQTSDEDRRALAANVMGLAITVALIALVITQIYAAEIAALLPGDVSVADCRVLLITLALTNLILVPLGWMRLQGQAWLYMAGTAGRIGFQALLGIGFLFMGFGVSAVLWAGLIASVIGAFYLLRRQYQETGIRFEPVRFRRFSLYGGPLVCVGIAGFVLGSFDRWILAHEVGTAEMALYALALKFGLITAVLIEPYDLWWHARRFTVLNEEDGARRCARQAEFGIVIAMLAALAVTAIAPLLLTWLTPVAYHPAIQYVPWLAGLAALHNITAQFSLGAMSQQNTRWPAAIDVTAAVIAFICYLWWIPLWQCWGAIAATAVALVIRCLLMIGCSQRILWLPFRMSRLTLMATLAVLLLATMPLEPSLASLLDATARVLLAAAAALLAGMVPGFRGLLR